MTCVAITPRSRKNVASEKRLGATPVNETPGGQMSVEKATYRAVGARMSGRPMSPPKVLEALEATEEPPRAAE
jgi:hypothetical protein